MCTDMSCYYRETRCMRFCNIEWSILWGLVLWTATIPALFCESQREDKEVRIQHSSSRSVRRVRNRDFKNIKLPTWPPLSFGRTVTNMRGENIIKFNVIWSKRICIHVQIKSVFKGSGYCYINASSSVLAHSFHNKCPLFLSWLRNESGLLFIVCCQVTTRNKLKFYLTYVPHQKRQ